MSSKPILIPWRSLSNDSLIGVVQEFVSREGTEYGWQEVELNRKVSQVIEQIRGGKVLICFDPETQTTNLIPAD